jgi:hypothetical protein
LDTQKIIDHHDFIPYRSDYVFCSNSIHGFFLSSTSLAEVQLLRIKDQLSPQNFKPQSFNSPREVLNLSSLEWSEDIEKLAQLSRFELELPEGFNVTAERIRTSPSLNGGTLWVGRLKNDPYSSVILVFENKTLAGFVTAGGQHYNINTLSEEESFLYQSQTRNQGLQGQDFIIPETNFGSPAPVTTTTTDNFVDVVVGYTTEAAANMDIEPTIQAAMAATNQMLADSCANFRYRLVGLVNTGVANGASDGATVLTSLRNTTGPYAGLHAQRDALGADLVHLYVDSNNLGVCGIAYLGQVGFFDEEFGMGLTLYGCPDFVLAHELGHNMSLAHDRFEQNVDLTDPSAPLGEHYGYVDTVNGFESIMSYSNHCNAIGLACDTLNKFSNPNISHEGVPFGIDEFANGVDGMNRAFPFVANYRNAVTSFDPGVNNNCSSSTSDKDLHCFIATAAYGSSLHPKIQILRDFRDHFLKTHWIGSFFVKLYYQFSPPLAQTITKNPALKRLVRMWIEALLFVIENPLFILLFLFLLIWGHPLMIFAAILFLFHSPLKAQVAATPVDPIILTENPAINFNPSPTYYLALGADLIQLEGSPTAGTSLEEAGTRLGLLVGYRDADYFFNIRFDPSWDRQFTLSQSPFNDAETTEQNTLIALEGGVQTSLMPIGVRISQSTETTVNANGVESSAFNDLSVNLGSQLNFSGILFGGGLIFSQLEQEDKILGDSASTNSLSLYVGLGFAANNMSAGLSNFGGSTSADPRKGFQAELSYQRDPEVLALEGNVQLARPETGTLRVFLQYGAGTWFGNFEYQSQTQQSLDNIFNESNTTATYQVGVGYQGSGWGVTFYPAMQQESAGFQREGFLFGVNLFASFGSSGSSFGSSL